MLAVVMIRGRAGLRKEEKFNFLLDKQKEWQTAWKK
jgi:hypothetical protein